MKQLSNGMVDVIHCVFDRTSHKPVPALFVVSKKPNENKICFSITDIGYQLNDIRFVLDNPDRIESLINFLTAAKEEMNNIETGEK